MKRGMKFISLLLGSLIVCKVALAGGLPFGVRKTIQIPGGLGAAFDISWVDDDTQTYFLADAQNLAIDIVDAKRDTLINQFIPSGPPFGKFVNNPTCPNFGCAGPLGVLEIPQTHQLWVGDANSEVWLIDVTDLKAPKVLDVISTALPSNPSDPFRADELSFDSKNGVILITNPSDPIPFVSLISTRTRKVIDQITFPNATNGLEQSVYNPRTGLFYLQVPEANDAGVGGPGEVVSINPATFEVKVVAKTGQCEGAGMALFESENRLLLGCNADEVITFDLNTGRLTTITGVTGGSDEVWFDPNNKILYLADVIFTDRAGMFEPSLGVVDAASSEFITNIFDGSNNPFATFLHSVAANKANNHVFVPLAANSLPFDNDPQSGLNCKRGCIGVFFGNFPGDRDAQND